jgi:hypothetical protein
VHVNITRKKRFFVFFPVKTKGTRSPCALCQFAIGAYIATLFDSNAALAGEGSQRSQNEKVKKTARIGPSARRGWPALAARRVTVAGDFAFRSLVFRPARLASHRSTAADDAYRPRCALAATRCFSP